MLKLSAFIGKTTSAVTREKFGMSEKKVKVTFKNRYGEDISFLVRKKEKQSKPKQVLTISLEWLENYCKNIPNNLGDYTIGYQYALEDLLIDVKEYLKAEKELEEIRRGN